MRILFVAPWVPTKVRPRGLGMLRALASNHDVFLVCLGSLRSGDELADLGLAGWTAVPMDRAHAAARLMGAAINGRSLQVSLIDSPGMRRAVSASIESFNPDVVHFNVIRTAGLMSIVPERLPIVFDMDETRSRYYKQLASSGRDPARRILGKLEHGRLVRAENEAIGRSRLVYVSSPTELVGADRKVRLSRSRIDLPTPVSAPNIADRDPIILFVGRMSYFPNREGLMWFVERVFPALSSRFPNCRLVVAGEAPGTDVSRLASDKIDVLGFVDDLQPLYESARMAIVPVFTGTGAQMKLLQALAAGTPAVTTSLAAAGVGVSDRREILVGDSAGEWVSRCSELLSDGKLADQLAASGVDWARREFDDASIAAAILADYRTIAAGR